MRTRAISMSSRLGPNIRVSVGQAATQAGRRPSCSRSQQRLHFWILGFQSWYSNLGTSNGQETMQ